MAISYSNKKLTDALQRLVEREKTREERQNPITTHISDQELASKSNPGIGQFLRERAAYRDTMRDVNIGRY